MITKNCTPKQHRTACPVEVAELTQTTTLDVTEADTQNPLLIERGIKLLNHLVERANQGESVGVGYAQFVCCVHGQGAQSTLPPIGHEVRATPGSSNHGRHRTKACRPRTA